MKLNIVKHIFFTILKIFSNIFIVQFYEYIAQYDFISFIKCIQLHQLINFTI